jgi:hypothetical protein
MDTCRFLMHGGPLILGMGVSLGADADRRAAIELPGLCRWLVGEGSAHVDGRALSDTVVSSRRCVLALNT